MLMDTIKVLDSATEVLTVSGDKFIGAAVYDIAGSTLTQPTDASVLMRFSVNRAFTLPAGLTGSKAESVIASTASSAYPLKKNGSSIGTIDFAIAGTDATFTFASPQSFAIGDILTLEAPATADVAHDELSWTLAGTLT